MTPFSTPPPQLFFDLSLLKGRYQLRFSEIVLIEAQRNYTEFHTRHGQRILTSKSLSFYRDKLPTQLLRIHKTYFVNLLFVKAFDGEFVYLTDGRHIPVSRRKRRGGFPIVSCPLWFFNGLIFYKKL